MMNPDLHLPCFLKRHVDKIHMAGSVDNWKYINTFMNPADVGTRFEVNKK